VEHFYIKFGDPDCKVYRDSMWKNMDDADIVLKNRHTDKQR